MITNERGNERKVFLQPLQNGKPKPVLQKGEVSGLFGNLLDILNVSKTLLQMMEETMGKEGQEEEKYGELFLRIGPFFKLYKTYCAGYDAAVQLMTHLKETNGPFLRFLQQTNGSALALGLSFHNFLIMPVQRVPRYSLLVGALLHHTDPSHPDFKNLEAALALLNSVALHINDMVQDEENRLKVIQMQQHFVMNQIGLSAKNLVEPHRRFVMEGWVSVLLGSSENSNSKPTRSFLLSLSS